MNKKSLLVLAILVLAVGLFGCDNKKKQPVVDEKDPYDQTFPAEILEAYKTKIEEIEKAHKAEQAKLMEEDPDFDIASLTNLKYDFAFINDDNIPELLVTNTGHSLAVYTYVDGKIVYTMQDEGITDEHGWLYGIAGNTGYDYVPRANVIRNYNNEYAGLVRYVSFNKLDEKTNQMVPVYDEALKEFHFNDKNLNNEIDEDEADDYVKEPVAFFFGENEITKEEYDAKLIDGDFEELVGRLSAAKMVEKIESLKK
ncbi:MAG: hypothetical protein IKI57_01030 [Clostridia bacterium]|nr:hypothetical protein [Clostridia bacterium]